MVSGRGEEELLTVQDAARELDVTDGAVRLAILKGRLQSTMKYGRKLIMRADIEEYKRRTRPTGEKPRGRPRKLAE